MDRRDFLTTMAAVPALSAVQPEKPAPQSTRPVPNYRVVTNHKPAPHGGMPGQISGTGGDRALTTVHRRSDREGRRAQRAVDDGARHVHAHRRQGPARQLGALLQRRGLRRDQGQCLGRAGRDVDAGGRGGDLAQPGRRRGQADQHRDSRARRRTDSPAEVRSVRARGHQGGVRQHLARPRFRTCTSKSTSSARRTRDRS